MNSKKIFVYLIISFLTACSTENLFDLPPDGYKSADFYKVELINSVLRHKQNLDSIVLENNIFNKQEFGLEKNIPEIVDYRKSEDTLDRIIRIDSLIYENFPRRFEDAKIERHTFEITPNPLKYPGIKSAFRDSIIVLPNKGDFALALVWNLDCKYWYLSSVRCIKVE